MAVRQFCFFYRDILFSPSCGWCYKKQIMLLVSVLSDLHKTINTLKREFLKFWHRSGENFLKIKLCVLVGFLSSTWSPHTTLFLVFYILRSSCCFSSLFLYFYPTVTARNLDLCSALLTRVKPDCFLCSDLFFSLRFFVLCGFLHQLYWYIIDT